jgi:stage II sporulation protein GA (sporulation sigma-E factor processing peptidase)
VVVIYADILFLINTIINYLLLIITARICDSRVKRIRCALSAAAGGLYAVGAVMFPSIACVGLKLLSGAAMVLIAFGFSRGLLRSMLVFFAASAAFAGAVYAAAIIAGRSSYGFVSPVTLKILFFSFAVCYVVLSLVFRRSAKAAVSTVSVRIIHNGRSISFMALIDTGNGLKDPITGARAIIISVSRAAELFDRDCAHLISDLSPENKAQTLCALNSRGCRFRLLPYSTVGGGGMLLAFTPERVEINGKIEKGAVVALTQSNISDGGAYSALIGA